MHQNGMLSISDVNLATMYLDFKEFVLDAGFENEIDWQAELNFDDTTETDFLREAAWVVLNSGFRESVVRSFFPRISNAFFDWKCANRIAENVDYCISEAIAVFGNRPKIQAIAQIALAVHEIGFSAIRKEIKEHTTEYLKRFPFIGPVTTFHLAKNLGIPTSKPDRHLVRLANFTGFNSVRELCCRIGEIVGDSVAVVDLVLWRYATLNNDFIETVPNFSLSQKNPQSKLCGTC